jgi:hypothetical protein
MLAAVLPDFAELAQARQGALAVVVAEHLRRVREEDPCHAALLLELDARWMYDDI